MPRHRHRTGDALSHIEPLQLHRLVGRREALRRLLHWARSLQKHLDKKQHEKCWVSINSTCCWARCSGSSWSSSLNSSLPRRIRESQVLTDLRLWPQPFLFLKRVTGLTRLTPPRLDCALDGNRNSFHNSESNARKLLKIIAQSAVIDANDRCIQVV